MPYDKIVDSAKLDAEMKATANAIRAKTGGTSGLPWRDSVGFADAVRAISQAEDLDAELDAQESKLTELLATLEGKAAGGGAADPDLPPGYRRASYIQFTGDQEIDTGIIPNQNTTIKIWFTRESSASQYLYGVASDGNTASVTAYLSSGGSWRFGAKSASRTVGVDTDIIRTAIVSKTGIEHEGGTNAFSDTAGFTAIGTLIIGGVRNANGTIASPQFIGKMFGLEILDGTEIVRKLVPVVDTKDVYRFFDLVSQEFFDSITDVLLDGGNL